MEEYKTSEAQRKASAKYKSKHPSKQRRYSDKSAAKRFIRSASKKELKEVELWIDARGAELEGVSDE